jgi:hypothetical protein
MSVQFGRSRSLGRGEDPPVEEATGPEAVDDPSEGKAWAESLGDGQLEGDRWYHILFKLFFPISIYFLFYGCVVLIYGSDMASEWTNMTFLFLVPPAGTGVIVPLGISKGFSGLTMALTVTMVDVVISMYICWWLVLLKKIPGIGRIFIWLEEKAGKKIEADPKLKRGSWWVIYTVLLVPIQGSGGMNMSIIGRMIGMRADSIITAVGAGSLTVALFFAFLATIGFQLLEYSLWAFIIFLILTLQGVVLVYWSIRWTKMRMWEGQLAKEA